MSSQFNLIHLRPDLQRFLPWATRHRLLPERGQGDLGYAFHAALKSVWADMAPQPFSYRAGQGLLAYSSESAEALRASAELAVPALAQMLGLDESSTSPGLLIRPFPQRWKTGQMFSFEVRARPIVRKEDQEIDAFLSAALRQPEAVLSRAAVYRDWLTRQFGNAAELLECHLQEFRLAPVIRRAAPASQDFRPKRPVMGPDAVFSGALQVRDEAAFTQLVGRGVGRHRAFGYGMLLLKPFATRWD
jgi:CRISPR system Cascade subunit CasE